MNKPGGRHESFMHGRVCAADKETAPPPTWKESEMARKGKKKSGKRKRAGNEKKKSSQPKSHAGNSNGIWELRLYIAGYSPKSVEAYTNLKKICEEHLAGKYKIEIIDLLKTSELARGDQILAVPTLVRKLPEPVKKIIGDLSNTKRVLIGLNIRPVR